MFNLMSELAKSRKQLKGKTASPLNDNHNAIYGLIFLLIKAVYRLDLLLHGPCDVVIQFI